MCNLPVWGYRFAKVKDATRLQPKAKGTRLESLGSASKGAHGRCRYGTLAVRCGLVGGRGATAAGGMGERCDGRWLAYVFRCCIMCLWARSRSSACNVSGRTSGRSDEDGQTAGAHEELVTGYAEYRASLAARKNYRKAEDIDLRLPQASTALGGAPRMRNYARTEDEPPRVEGGVQQARWRLRVLARGGGHSEGSDEPGRPVWRLLRAGGPRRVCSLENR